MKYFINIFKRVNIFIYIVLFLILSVGFNVNAAENNNVVEKVFCNATLNDDFANNRVLVVLNKEASQSFKTYTKNDFTEIDCSNVEDLTKPSGESVKFQKEFNSDNSNNLSTNGINFKDIDIDNFKTVLSLELNVESKQNVLNIIKILEKRDDIYYVGPDYAMSVSTVTPDDPEYINGNQWVINNIDLPQAWDFSTGSTNVLVGVMDTGIDGNHPDLTNRINRNLCRDFTGGSTVVVNNPIDPYGHGTHVAGIIGAQGDNGEGIAGTCWNVSLVSLRTFDENGYGYSSYVANAIRFATEQGIQILNLSAGWPDGHDAYDEALDTIIESYPGILICAAGNESSDNDINHIFPASYNLK